MATWMVPLVLGMARMMAGFASNAPIEDDRPEPPCLLSGVYLSNALQYVVFCNATLFMVNGWEVEDHGDGRYGSHQMLDILGNGTFVIATPTTMEYTSAMATTVFEHSFGLEPDDEISELNDNLLKWTEGALTDKSRAPDYDAFDHLVSSASNPDALKFFFARDKASVYFFNELKQNVREDSVDVQRANMDRFSEVFYHVHVTTLPRHHWGLLERYASSHVETEGSGNGDNSFGDYLHVNGEQVMESWETKWMRKLANYGLSKTRSALPGQKINVLELGWGQGISGRQLLSHPNVNYTVIELHPTIAENARAVFKKLGAEARVLQGSWEHVLASVPNHQFDMIFADIWDTTRENDRVSWEYNARGENDVYDQQFWSLYRVLRPNGAHVWFETGQAGRMDLSEKTVWYETNMFSELHLKKLGGLRPYKETTYVQQGWDESFLPAGIK